MSEPPIDIRATFSSFTAGDNANPTRVVLHATCPTIGYPGASTAGEAMATARYFAGGTAGGSAHYVEDASGEAHCVPDNTVAFHAPPNQASIGIEVCAEGGQYAQSYTREQWLSPAVWPAVARAAARTRELCDRFGIPTVRIGVSELLAGAHGICGHVDVSNAWRQSTHSDPGDGWPWPEFMAAVTGNTPTPSAPREVDPVTDIPITVNPDGTFRTTVCVEAGTSSLVVDRAFITFGSAWGATDFRVCALDTNGSVMGPAGQKVVTVPNNHRDYLEIPSGAVLATIEGTAPAGARPAAALVAKAK